MHSLDDVMRKHKDISLDKENVFPSWLRDYNKVTALPHVSIGFDTGNSDCMIHRRIQHGPCILAFTTHLCSHTGSLHVSSGSSACRFTCTSSQACTLVSKDTIEQPPANMQAAFSDTQMVSMRVHYRSALQDI